MKAKIDPDICIGCSLCVQTCPGVFRMEKDKAVVFVETVPEKFKGDAIKAAGECPVDAIVIIE